MFIREATTADAPRLAAIYAYYTEHTAISFEYTAPTAAEFAERMTHIIGKYPYLAAEENGQVVGFAYAHPFIEREAYRYACEVTIYVDKAYRRHGCGKALYHALEEALRQTKITNLYACVGVTDTPDEYLDNNSADFHRHMGYREVGRFRNCGYKFNRWYSMIWMEKLLREPSPSGKEEREANG